MLPTASRTCTLTLKNIISNEILHDVTLLKHKRNQRPTVLLPMFLGVLAQPLNTLGSHLGSHVAIER